jgi:hypothetical protein
MQQQADRAATSHLHVKTNPVSHHEAACLVMRPGACLAFPIQLFSIEYHDARPSDCRGQCGGRLYMCADH